MKERRDKGEVEGGRGDDIANTNADWSAGVAGKPLSRVIEKRRAAQRVRLGDWLRGSLVSAYLVAKWFRFSDGSDKKAAFSCTGMGFWINPLRMNLPPPDFVDDTPPSRGTPAVEPPELPAAVSLPEPTAETPAKSATAEKAKEPEDLDDTWPGLVVEALRYPVRGASSATLLIGVLLGVGIALASWVPIAGPLLALLGWLYFASYSLSVVECGISQSRAPDWPELSNAYENVLSPAFQVLGVGLLAVLPGFLLARLGGEESAEGLTFFGVLGLIHQWLYLPMGMAGLAVTGSISGALPHRIWPAILRSFPEYGVVFMIFAALALLNDFALEFLSWVPILGSIVAVTLSIYLLMVQSRFTATMYLNLQEKIKF
jgi:hypothetical protein